jgi:diguanylate cyclase (GGDEF)-like protein
VETKRTSNNTRKKSAGAPFWIYLSVTGLLCGIGFLAPETTAGALAMLAIAVSVPVMIVVGTRMHRPGRQAPWLMVAAASICSTVPAIVRGVDPTTDETLLLQIPIVLSYFLLIASLSIMLRARRGPGFRGAVVDAMLLTLAAAVFVWSFFTVPTIQSEVFTLGTAALKASFPIMSVVIVFLIGQLALTRIGSSVSFRFFVFGLSLVVIADIGLAAIDAGYTQVVPPAVLAVGYVFVGVCAAAAALHPDMVHMTERVVVVNRPFSVGRAAVLAAAEISPLAAALLRADLREIERIPLIVAGVAIVALIMWRVTDAVRQYAESEQRLAHQATHDSLTGLPNRAWTQDRLETLLTSDEAGDGLAVLFCDLDRFKHVNDTWGHEVGDELLVQVAARLGAVAGELGAAVSRIGGDEFIMFQEGISSAEEAVRLASSALDAFEPPFDLGVGTIHIAPSVGVAWVPLPDTTGSAHDMIRRADTAMYVAKASDGQYAMFDDSMRDAVARRLTVENELRGAVERGEMALVYQPVVSLADGAVRNFEALVRWHHPERGMVPPDEFIPICEETGLIVELGAWILDQVCETVATWARIDPQRCPQVAVNVSGRQLRDATFAQRVHDTLARHGVSGDKICIEITETVMLDDTDTTAEQLRRIAAFGVPIAVDDFGTGYSSLSYLKEYPVSRVKIDRSFVWGLGQSDDDEVIVDAVLAMADALSLAVVAEGIETEAQRAHLAARGCAFGQGYLFDRPLPVDAALAVWQTSCAPTPVVRPAAQLPRRVPASSA